MVHIITADEFDRIYDNIVWEKILKKELNIYKQPLKDYLFNKFIIKNTYRISYENNDYYVLTDAYKMTL